MPVHVAAVLNDDGTVYDFTYNWETAQNMALQGYRILALTDDGHMSKDDIQRLCDAELDRHNDCFGKGD